MRKVIIPATNLSVSRFSFGTASLHHLFDSSKRQYLLSAAFDAGFTHFDTAPYYGLGIAETEMGKFLKLSRKAVTIATKIGLYPNVLFPPSTLSVYLHKVFGKILPLLSRPQVNWSLQKCEASLYQSLRQCRTDCIDILFLHEPIAQILPADELLQWLKNQQKLGKIRYWGLAGELDKFETLVEQNHPLAQIIQMRDSIQNRQSQSLIKWRRPAQFTYGYLSGLSAPQKPEIILKEAFQLNQTGSIIISSRQPHRILEYPKMIESIEQDAQN